MTKDKSLKLALEALEHCCFSDALVTDRDVAADAILAIKQALAQPEQEPVAWSYLQSCLNDDGTQTEPWVHRLSQFKPHESIINKDVVPLYTAPPKREWVGLTDEEIQTIVNKVASEYQTSDTFAKAIEAKLREKNT